jgi:hypothetical protein
MPLSMATQISVCLNDGDGMKLCTIFFIHFFIYISAYTFFTSVCGLRMELCDESQKYTIKYERESLLLKLKIVHPLIEIL